MAIGKKNSGFFKQDAVMGKLSADARKPYKVNAIVEQALESRQTTQSLFGRESKEPRTEICEIVFRISQTPWQ